MNPADNIVPGSLWHKQTVKGQLPPLVPSLPPQEDSDWDSSFIPHGYGAENDIRAERRHSGWAFVEKNWIQAQETEAKGKAKAKQPPKECLELLAKLRPSLSLPPPQLEVDFRMKVVLNSNVATMAVGSGSKQWTTFTEGVWSGSIGSGSVVGGGQDSTEMEAGRSQGTQIELTFKLKTIDETPAFIECKARGFRTGPEAVMNALKDPIQAQSIDPRQYRHRTLITMRTNDPRYAGKVNFELWIGTSHIRFVEAYLWAKTSGCRSCSAGKDTM
ncbi:hypothetical protein AB5N19_02029 [Seiridium cardinale]